MVLKTIPTAHPTQTSKHVQFNENLLKFSKALTEVILLLTFYLKSCEFNFPQLCKISRKEETWLSKTNFLF